MGYEISVKASEDIENTWLYTFENWSLEQADRYINNDKEGEEFKQKMQKYFDSTVAFLEQNDIDKIIT